MPDLQDAISLLEKGKARDASVLLADMAAEMPGYATARVLLARAYEGLGEWSSALEAWREALQIVPNSPVIRRGLERAVRNATASSESDETAEPSSVRVSSPPPGEVEVVGLGAAASETDDHPATSAETRSRPTPEDEDLDRLIAELESARIVPRPDLDTLPEPDLEDDIDDVVSVTLARIYASQGQYDEAARVYELLAAQQPASVEQFKARAAEMRSKASEG